MKKILLIYFYIFTFFFSYAQKELWGNNKTQSYIDYTDPANPLTILYYGNITKYDINGQNATIVHVFDGVNGKLPNGKLLQASNGKLYGLTSIYTGTTAIENNACLFEYDLILNKYNVLYSFDQALYYSQYMRSGVIEGFPNKLFGSIRNTLFCYDLITGIMSFGQLSDFFYADLTGEFTKGIDGFLYGTMYYSSLCPTSNAIGPFQGIIIKINPITLTNELKYSFACDYVDGTEPSGGQIETTQNKIYGTSYGGGDLLFNAGTLYEYKIMNNTFIKRVSFDGNNLGAIPSPLVNAGNDILYGVCRNGGTNEYFDAVNNITVTNHYGTLFKYDTTSNIVSKLHDFGTQQLSPLIFSGLHPTSIMKASTGLYFGVSDIGLFKFNPIDTTVVMTTPIGCTTCPVNEPLAYATESLIEICRKPSYHEFLPNTYAPEQGTAFTFNVQNTNATSYIWKKGIIVLPAQTTGILNIPSVTANDTGVYTCTMTNECGETVTMPLNINVTNLGTDNIDNYKELISLFPNPTKSTINLKFPANRGLKGLKYKITNLLGQTIQKQEIAKINSKNELTIDTAGFVKGVYQLTLTTDKGDWNGKFVKE